MQRDLVVLAQPAASEATRLVARADALADHGEGPAALYLYQQVLREFAGDPAVAAALYGLGRVYTDPAHGQRNYRAASMAFSQLLTDYPHSRWALDARASRSMRVLLRSREEEAAGLKVQLQQLRKVDLDLERRR